VDRVGVAIVVPVFPDDSAAMRQGVWASLPGLLTRLPLARIRVVPPERLPGIEAGAFDEAADAESAAGGTADCHVAHDERSERERFPDVRIGDLALPDLLAGRLVDREQAAIERDRDHLVLPERYPAVVHAAAGDVAGPGLVGLGIELPPECAFL